MSHDRQIQVHEETQKEVIVSANTREGFEEDLDPVAKSQFNAALKESDWSPEDEKKLLRRLDFYLIPLVMVMFFTLNLDR